jgi:flagellar hook-basal body complex protein FliE
MSISAIEGVLQQMRAVQRANPAGELSGASGPAVAGASSAGFAGELKKSLERVSQAQVKASNQAESFELGVPGVGINDVMVDLQKANIGFQMSLQVRNRMVAAYQEIMNMQA